jgi:hypothetical protein
MHPMMLLGGAAGVALALAIPLVAPRTARSQDGASLAPIVWFLPGAGERALLRLPAERDRPAGIVIVLGDGGPAAGRHAAILQAAGLAVLELGADGRKRDADGHAASLATAEAALRGMPGLAGLRLGALGFDAGARAVLDRGGMAATAGVAGAACAALPDLPAGAPRAALPAPLLLLAAGGAHGRFAALPDRLAAWGSLETLPCFEAATARDLDGFTDEAEAIARIVWFLADLMAPHP